jgi:hypothetical protein
MSHNQKSLAFSPMLLLIPGILFSIGLTVTASAAGPDQTAAGGNNGQPLSNPTNAVQYVRRALDNLDLRDDQKTRLNAILDKADRDAAAMADELKDLTPAQRQQRAMPFFQDLRDRIADVLDDAQKQQLMASLPARAAAAVGAAGGAGAAGGGLGAPIIQRVKTAVDQLSGLSEDQKKQIAELIEQTQTKVQDLRQQAANGGDRQKLREQGLQIIDDFRNSMQTILEPQQLQQLRAMMQQAAAQNGGGGSGLRLGGNGRAAATTRPTANSNTERPGRATRPAETAKKAVAANTPAAAQPANPATEVPTSALPGSVAPDFKLQTLDNRLLQLSQYHERVLVIEFGSYTCPAFRDRAAQMEQLKTETSAKATFLVVYTREAHPAGGGWEVERNKDDNISIAAPTDLPGRRELARQAHDVLHISIPMAIDAMDDEVTDSYGGFPNAAVIIGRDGKIAARQNWCDPSGLRRLIDAAGQPRSGELAKDAK